MKRNLILLLFVIFILGLVFFLANAFFYTPGGKKLGVFAIDYSYHPDLLGDYAPNQDIISYQKPKLPFHFTTNQQGYRRREVTIPKPKDEYRILMLGDSIVEGPYVNDNQTLPAQLEKVLDDQFFSQNITVINAGHSGYTITDVIDYFQEKGYQFQADLVILAFTAGNDISDLTKPIAARQYLKNLYQQKSKNLALRISAYLIQKFPLLKYLYQQKTKLLVRLQKNLAGGGTPAQQLPQIETDLIFAETYSPELNNLVDQYLKALKNFYQELSEQNIDFLLVLVPDKIQFDDKSKALNPQATVNDFALNQGINSLDLFFDLSQVYDSGLKIFLTPEDPHPNSRGYEIMAQAIAKRIKLGNVNSSPLPLDGGFSSP